MFNIKKQATMHLRMPIHFLGQVLKTDLSSVSNKQPPVHKMLFDDNKWD